MVKSAGSVYVLILNIYIHFSQGVAVYAATFYNSWVPFSVLYFNYFKHSSIYFLQTVELYNGNPFSRIIFT